MLPPTLLIFHRLDHHLPHQNVDPLDSGSTENISFENLPILDNFPIKINNLDLMVNQHQFSSPSLVLRCLNLNPTPGGGLLIIFTSLHTSFFFFFFLVVAILKKKFRGIPHLNMTSC
jgi:hypothetical protein